MGGETIPFACVEDAPLNIIGLKYISVVLNQTSDVTTELAEPHSHMTDLAMFVRCKPKELSLSVHERIEWKGTTLSPGLESLAGSSSESKSLQ